MNRTGARGLFVILAVLAGILAAFNVTKANQAASLPLVEERSEALGALAGLNEQEKALVAELLDWDVRLAAARQDHERLAREIPVAEQAVKDAEAALSLSREQLSVSEERLGRWVNFLYRYGPVAYLEVVLQATDFNDFATRFEALKTVVVSQVRLIDEVKELKGRQEEQAAGLRQARADLEVKTAALSQRIADMDRERAGREAFLARLKEQSADLNEKVIQSETALYQSIDSLRYLISHLGALPWDNLSPQKFSLTGRGLSIEYLDQEVNRVFFEQGDPNLAAISVQSLSGLFAICGRADTGGADYRLEGTFVPEAAGKVRFEPSRALLAGLPVSAEVLRYIASAESLSFDFGSRTQGYRLTQIRPEPGKLIIELSL